MGLVSILVVIVAILALLIGVTVMFGSKSNEKVLSGLFFATVFSASLWALSVIAFLNLPKNAGDIAPMIVAIIYVSSLLMAISMFGYAARFTKAKYGNVFGIVFVALALLVSALIIVKPELLYSSISLDTEFGNVVNLRFGLLYGFYTSVFVLVFVCYAALLLMKILSKTSMVTRNICVLLLLGPGICAVVSLIFDLVLPFYRYDLIWIGPVSIDIAIIAFYYAILKYRMITVRVWWMKIMSYIVLVATMSLVYVSIFFLVSAIVMESVDIRIEVLILNFIMIAVVFLAMPFLSELMTNMRSLLSINSVDVGHVAKKIKKTGSSDADMKELACFLADHLHFSYIGLLVNDKLYSSKEVVFSAKDIEITSIQDKYEPEKTWQGLSEENKNSSEYPDLRTVVDLRDMNGQPFGKFAIGAPFKEGPIEQNDIRQLEMIVNLVAIAVDPMRTQRK